jgi:hypothetical protein
MRPRRSPCTAKRYITTSRRGFRPSLEGKDARNMSWLFGDDFAARADLQRRQAFHQELLDSRRFGVPSGIEASDALQHPKIDGGTAGNFASQVGAFLALIFFFYTIPAAILSAAAALPVSLALFLLDRLVSRRRTRTFGETYRAATIGVFALLTTAAILFVAFAAF